MANSLDKISMKVEPPGPEAQKIIERDKKFMGTMNKVMPVVGVRGKGLYVEDVDGNVYLDFLSGIAVNNLGHCPPPVVKAVQDQVDPLPRHSLLPAPRGRAGLGTERYRSGQLHQEDLLHLHRLQRHR